ncbi:MAG: ROK family protein [Terracidiphilus sp.]
MATRWVAGVDIGGTKTAVVLSAAPPAVVGRIEFPTEPEHGPEPAIARIVSALHALLREQNALPADLGGIGISCGSPLDRAAGIVQAPPNLPTWVDVPIVAILSAAFGCPARLENDANAGALAEHRYGAGRSARHMLFLTLGTGFGAGVILNGQLYTGASDLAGEIGHVRLTRTGPVGYHKAGSAEGWASGGGMAQLSAEALRRAARRGEASSLLDLPSSQPPTARDVGLAALAGDALARRILRESGRKLGMALAILIDVLNPERIVLGGLAMRLGDLLLDPARAVLRREALAPSVAACRIVPAELGERIGDVAALCVVPEPHAHFTGGIPCPTTSSSVRIATRSSP